MSHKDANSFGIDLAQACLASRSDQAIEVLRSVASLTSARAGALVTFDGTSSDGEVAASFGHRPGLLTALAGADYHKNDRSYQEIVNDPDRGYRSWWNVGFDFSQSSLARRYLVPSGFGGGVTMRLSDQGGRHVGDLHVSTSAHDDPKPDATDLLWSARSVLAKVCAQSLSSKIALPSSASHSLIVNPALDAVSVIDSNAPERDAGVADLALHLVRSSVADGRGTRTAARWRDGQGQWHLFESTPIAEGVTVTVTPSTLPYAISPRELEVLSLLAEGLTNYSISRRLQISERTASHTVARVFAKLDVSSRAAAAAAAERLGLKLLTRKTFHNDPA